MAALGVMAKIRVPYAHTSLEVVRMRYGKIGHLIFIVLNLVNNVFGCASMIMTGSQLIHGISNMHYVAATILIPLGGGYPSKHFESRKLTKLTQLYSILLLVASKPHF